MSCDNWQTRSTAAQLQLAPAWQQGGRSHCRHSARCSFLSNSLTLERKTLEWVRSPTMTTCLPSSEPMCLVQGVGVQERLAGMLVHPVSSIDHHGVGPFTDLLG
jgi:hypothetical protein